MEKAGIAIVAGILMSLSVCAHAEIKIVNVKKVDKDIYKTSDGAYIETSYCYVETSGENAVLNYEKYACGNNIKFINAKTTCEVIAFF